MRKQNLLIFITPTIVQSSDFQVAKTDFLQSQPRTMADPMNMHTSWDSAQPRGDWSNPIAPDQAPTPQSAPTPQPASTDSAASTAAPAAAASMAAPAATTAPASTATMPVSTSTATTAAPASSAPMAPTATGLDTAAPGFAK